MDETLIGVHSLAGTSGNPAGGCSYHRPLHRAARNSSQQKSSDHSDTASNNGALYGLFPHSAGLMGQGFTLIHILTDSVGPRIAIRIHRRPVTAMRCTPGKNQSHE